MSVRNASWCLAILAGWLTCGVCAQEAIRWQVSLDAARQLAGRSGRLVLVHFWADWCRPCMVMEREVFTRPDVAAALEAEYVPVKVHKDHFPILARQYGVTSIPTDVILTPQGQVVQKFEGGADPAIYVARLSQVAAAYRAQIGRTYAQVGSEPAAMALPTTDWRPSPAPAQAPYAPGFTAGLPSPYGSGTVTASQGAPPGPQTAAPLVAGQFVPPITTPSAPPYRADAQASPGLEPPGQGLTGAVPAEAGPKAQQAQPNSPSSLLAAELPPGNPPLGLDGYCPVQLTDKERWVLGNRRWGVRHEGRTYLFAGPEEQQRFYADPERYAPVMSGDDIVLLIEQGQRMPGRREHGAWFQGRVYLFSSEATLQKFSADPNRYVNAVAEMRAQLATRPRPATFPAQSPQPPWPNPGALPVRPAQPYR